MIEDLLRRVLLNSRSVRLKTIEKKYATTLDQSGVEKYQLNRFNDTWSHSQKEIPFYKMWQEKHDLPHQIQHLRDLMAFPVLTKQDLIEHAHLIEMTPNVTRYTLTGGTSGLTTKFPMNRFDAQTAWLNAYLGRRWNDISHLDSLFMIWGHSHLFSGRYAKFKHAKRKFKDFMLGIKRVSAYDMSKKNLEEIYQSIAAENPSYIIGYGSCLTLLARYMKSSGYKFINGQIKLIVNTSEPIAPSESNLVSSIFGCPVVNEYGMAEAGVIGYSVSKPLPIQVMWHDYILGRKHGEIILTTIGKRCFPLINYSTEDDSPGEDSWSMTVIDQIQGKVRAILTVGVVGGGITKLSVVLLDHILKQLNAIASIHYEQINTRTIKVIYVASEPIKNADVFDWLKAHLLNEGIDIRPGAVIAEEINEPLSTLAGKRALIVKNKEALLKKR